MTKQYVIDTIRSIADRTFHLYDMSCICFTMEMWKELLQVRSEFEMLVVEMNAAGISRNIATMDFITADRLTATIMTIKHSATFQYPWESKRPR